MASQIDLFGFPSACIHLVLSLDIVPCRFSDYDAVFLVASLPDPFSRGPGRWLLSISLLQDSTFGAAFKST